MFHRERPEGEFAYVCRLISIRPGVLIFRFHLYSPIYAKYGVGTTVWSALASGVLTGKYNGGNVPTGSRFDNHADFFKNTIDSFKKEEGLSKIEKVRKLTEFAKTSRCIAIADAARCLLSEELDCSVGQLALAWVARNPNTSTIILGASKPEQVLDNLKALDVIPKLTPEVLEEIEAILDNRPPPHVRIPSSFL